MQPTNEKRGALDGVVIADFGRVLAGPYATMLLADMGATVIKVEGPTGDETRSWTPPVWQDEATYYLAINRNKKSIVLDFNDPKDLATAKQIAAKADVLVENFKPGGLAQFGLDYDSLSETNPGLIYASITGFGTFGGANMPGYDLLVQASSGMMSLTGAQDGSPMRMGVAVIDVMTGLHAAIGILSALNHRNNTGEGQRVEVNLLSSALSGLVNQASATLLSDSVPSRMGNEHPSIFPYGPFPTGDGDIVIATGNNRQFATLCAVLGLEGVHEDQQFASVALRNANRELLRPILEAALADKTAAEWAKLMQDKQVPCAPINDVRQGIELGERLGLAPVIEVGEGDRVIKGIANPISFSQSPTSYRAAPPKLGADSAWVREWLLSES